MTGRITLAVTLEVEVDEQAWAEVYGVGRRSLVADAEDYMLNLIQESPAAAEGALSVTGFAVREASA